MSHLLSDVRYLTPKSTLQERQWLRLSPNALCAQPFKKTAALGPDLANPASNPRFGDSLCHGCAGGGGTVAALTADLR